MLCMEANHCHQVFLFEYIFEFTSMKSKYDITSCRPPFQKQDLNYIFIKHYILNTKLIENMDRKIKGILITGRSNQD